MITDQDVLAAIERIVADDFCQDLDCMMAFHRETMSKTERECAEKLSAIYRLAHSFGRSHSCFDVHHEWRKEVVEALLPESA